MHVHPGVAPLAGGVARVQPRHEPVGHGEHPVLDAVLGWLGSNPKRKLRCLLGLGECRPVLPLPFAPKLGSAAALKAESAVEKDVNMNAPQVWWAAIRSAEARAVLARASSESTVDLLAEANCSGVVNMVISPEGW
jgi:hypothetical protein